MSNIAKKTNDPVSASTAATRQQKALRRDEGADRQTSVPIGVGHAPRYSALISVHHSQEEHAQQYVGQRESQQDQPHRQKRSRLG